ADKTVNSIVNDSSPALEFYCRDGRFPVVALQEPRPEAADQPQKRVHIDDRFFVPYQPPSSLSRGHSPLVERVCSYVIWIPLEPLGLPPKATRENKAGEGGSMGAWATCLPWGLQPPRVPRSVCLSNGANGVAIMYPFARSSSDLVEVTPFLPEAQAGTWMMEIGN
ncbi:hypothetical protein CORC01_11705, partial [Colletotrichum orchidophilum]